VILAALLFVPAATVPAAALAPSAAREVRFSYDLRALGLTVARIEATVDLDGAGYRATLTYHTVGLYGMLLPAQSATRVRGSWAGSGVEPAQYSSAAHLHGESRRVLIDYRDGNPDVRTLVPSTPGRWQPVPPALQAHTIDTLSAAVLLIHDVAGTGACDVSARTFDGHRLTEVQAHTTGDQPLPAADGSPYTGTVLRCDFVGQQLAGFENNDSAFAHQPHRGAAWFAQVLPGGPPLPVRLSFATHWFGDAVAVMTSAQLIAH
jgi:hypothetical protein